VPGEGAY